MADLDAPVGGELNNIFLPLMIYDIWNCMPNFIVYTVKVLQVLLTDVRSKSSELYDAESLLTSLCS